MPFYFFYNIININFMSCNKIFSLVLFLLISSFAFAQTTKKETYKVAGECGMCQKKIETAAKKAGARYASWNVDTKELTVTYNSTSSNTAKIQQAVANSGYDTPNFKASEAAYNSLHDCCKYERTAAATCCAKEGKEDCCKKEGATCCADGTCTKDTACCKDNATCKDATCCKKS
jgi:periplasmic mercuric ion binding protein